MATFLRIGNSILNADTINAVIMNPNPDGDANKAEAFVFAGGNVDRPLLRVEGPPAIKLWLYWNRRLATFDVMNYDPKQDQRDRG